MALKKRIPIKPIQPITSEVSTPVATKELPKRPVPPKGRKPIAPPVKRAPEPPKEVKPVEEAPEVKQAEPRKEGKSPEASKPFIPAGSKLAEPGHRRTDTPEVKRLPLETIRDMELEDRYKLFKSLNKNPEKFIPIRSELPKKTYMRKDEAVLRKLIEEKAPKTAKGLTVLYCVYCFDWQVFHYHSWTGYSKCTGCGMSTKDFYIGVDNKIFGKE